MRKMTNAIKAFIAVISILLAALLILAAIYFASLQNARELNLRPYYARREELLAMQERLNSMIAELNGTLQREAALNSKLGETFKNLTNRPNAASNPVITPQQMVTQPPLITQPSRPVSQPVVTRAS
ncbi:MAG: hypothetical protein V1837_05620 [Candidatus Woesearchaeota archaeon]